MCFSRVHIHIVSPPPPKWSKPNSQVSDQIWQCGVDSWIASRKLIFDWGFLFIFFQNGQSLCSIFLVHFLGGVFTPWQRFFRKQVSWWKLIFCCCWNISLWVLCHCLGYPSDSMHCRARKSMSLRCLALLALGVLVLAEECPRSHCSNHGVCAHMVFPRRLLFTHLWHTSF